MLKLLGIWLFKLLEICWSVLRNQRGSFPKFGCGGTVEQDSHTFNTDQLEFRDGFDTSIFSLKFTDTVRRSNPSSCAHTYGIGKSDNADGTK